MGRKDFFKFYRSLRVESDDKVKEIANFVFTAFDRDSNGKIDFTEFLCKSTERLDSQVLVDCDLYVFKVATL